ncbi:Uncharacterised protein [uncultured archaeon]|nr:Uncharacterised protein [uncultured archaeon]
MSMGLSLGCYQIQAQKQTLSHAQRLCLKQVLEVLQTLKHPEFPNAAKGLDGMLIADNILKSRNGTGVLIGGLAEEVWNKRTKLQDLYNHKDVDVLVLNKDFELKEDFEGGIDWWLPNQGRIKINSGSNYLEKNSEWNENLNTVILGFYADTFHKRPTLLRPGLYIPSSDFVIEMRRYEAFSRIDFPKVNVEIDDNFENTFNNRMRQKIKTSLPKFIVDKFKGQILSDKYERDYGKIDEIRLQGLSLGELRGINEFLGNYEKANPNP